ncbi:MAG: hypothetical protein AAFR51_00075 [Pseudomonadota bacterium]
MTSDSESRTVQITVLITPSEKAALEASKEKWGRSLGSEVHGRLAYTLALSDEIDFVDRAKSAEDPLEAFGEYEAYRKRLFDHMDQDYAIADAPVPTEVGEMDPNGVDSIGKLISDTIEEMIIKTDLEFDDNILEKMNQTDLLDDFSLDDLSIFEIISEKFSAASSDVLAMSKVVGHKAIYKRVLARLDNAAILLQRWAFFHLLHLNMKLKRHAYHGLSRALIMGGLKGAEGSLKAAELMFDTGAQKLVGAYSSCIQILSE